MKNKGVVFIKVSGFLAMMLTLFSLSALAQVPSPTPMYLELKIEDLNAQERSRRNADSMHCRANEVIVRAVDKYYHTLSGLNYSVYYHCAPAQSLSSPPCEKRLNFALPACIYTPPVNSGEVNNPNKKFSVGEAVDYVLKRLKEEFTETRGEAEVFIPFNSDEKSLASYIKTSFINPFSISDLWRSTSDTGTIPGHGLIAYTTPDAVTAWNPRNNAKIIPLKLRGPLSMIKLSALLFLRDEALPRRFGTKMEVDYKKLATQRQIFLKEIMARLKITAILDDNYQPTTSFAAQLGCMSYGLGRLNILDPAALSLSDAEVALGRQAEDEIQKTAAANLSYWYKLLGLAPYAQPSVPTKLYDDEVSRFIKDRFISCEKVPSLDELPNLAQKTPQFLAEVTHTKLLTTARLIHGFHWFRSSYVLKNMRGTDANDPAIVNYLDSHWRKFYASDEQRDVAGSGLYVSLTPPATDRYGNAVIDLTIPQGTRFLSFTGRKNELSRAALAELANLQCKVSDLQSLFYTQDSACRNISRALVKTLGISFTTYNYTVNMYFPKACKDASSPDWSMVVFDPVLLTPAHVTVYRRDPHADRTTLNTEQNLIAEYFRLVAKEDEAVDRSSEPAYVNPRDFSKWLNSEILGCGMGKNWQSGWE